MVCYWFGLVGLVGNQSGDFLFIQRAQDIRQRHIGSLIDYAVAWLLLFLSIRNSGLVEVE